MLIAADHASRPPAIGRGECQLVSNAYERVYDGLNPKVQGTDGADRLRGAYLWLPSTLECVNAKRLNSERTLSFECLSSGAFHETRFEPSSGRCQIALHHRRPRRAADLTARLCGDLADVEADYSRAGRALHRNRTRPTRHRRLGYPRPWSGHEECSHQHS